MSDQNPTAIRTDVPASMHPDALMNLSDTLAQKDTLGVNVWNVAREALQLCYHSYGMLNDTEKSVKEVQSTRRLVNGRPTEVAATSKELANAAEAAWKRVAPIIDRRVKELTGTQTVLGNRVAEALDDPNRKTPVGIALASEVSGYVKALPLEERTAFIANAINEGEGNHCRHPPCAAVPLWAYPTRALEHAQAGCSKVRAARQRPVRCCHHGNRLRNASRFDAGRALRQGHAQHAANASRKG
jgi:hypothetical protein